MKATRARRVNVKVYKHSATVKFVVSGGAGSRPSAVEIAAIHHLAFLSTTRRRVTVAEMVVKHTEAKTRGGNKERSLKDIAHRLKIFAQQLRMSPGYWDAHLFCRDALFLQLRLKSNLALRHGASCIQKSWPGSRSYTLLNSKEPANPHQSPGLKQLFTL